MLRLFVVLFVFVISCQFCEVSSKPSFVIDYENNQFLRDGKPFHYISGSMHYFRVPRIHWLDRLQRLRAAGLNAVQTYIDWSQHEPYPGKYDFSDNLDFVTFFKLAQKVGLLVILRPGPFIAGERDLCGLPFWLLQKNPNVKLRTNDPNFIKYVDLWFSKVMPMVKPYLYSNGGPVISIQIENEYGSLPTCDFDYMNHLRDLQRSLLGSDVILFTTDGSGDGYLKCGKIQEVYATVDFGPGENVGSAFHAQRNHEPKGPLVNSEYYPGWMDNWAYPHSTRPIAPIIQTLKEMFSYNASVNFYMFHGGTNFGFTNGGIMDPNYNSMPTSYDYDAPVSEGGDLTDKYYAIRQTITQHLKQDPPPVPKPIPKYAYGTVQMSMIGALFDILPRIRSQEPVKSLYPVTFEALGQAYGFVLYETNVSGLFMDPVLLEAKPVNDRAIVFVDEIPVGILSRGESITTMPIKIQNGEKLSLLVENMGRVYYSSGLGDFKGLLSNVTLGGKILTNWEITSLPFNSTQINSFAKEFTSNSISSPRTLADGRLFSPGLFKGAFVAPNKTSFPMDTYLNMTGWHKGIALINGFNVGRYWPVVGPQVTLYIPKSILKPYPSKNEVVLFELEHAPCFKGNNDMCTVEFVASPMINSTTPYNW